MKHAAEIATEESAPLKSAMVQSRTELRANIDIHADHSVI